MIKNNFFDKNQIMNDNLQTSSFPSVFKGTPGYVVNLDILSHGVKSDLSMKKVGSDTRSYLEYKDPTQSSLNKVKTLAIWLILGVIMINVIIPILENQKK